MPNGQNLGSTPDIGGGERPLHRNEVWPCDIYHEGIGTTYTRLTLPHASSIKNTNAIPRRVYSTLRCCENEHLLVVSLCIFGVHMEPAVTQGRAVIALYANRQTDCKLKQKNRDMVKF
jgi:hypothetical protein